MIVINESHTLTYVFKTFTKIIMKCLVTNNFIHFFLKCFKTINAIGGSIPERFSPK